MKARLNIHLYGRLWAIGLTVTLLLINQFAAAKAQTSPPKIALSDADSIFEQTLAQPTQFLQSTGISLENVERQSKRTRIVVVGAGFGRDLGLISSTFTFTNTQISLKPKSDIQVIGAGSADTISLVSPQFGDLTQQTSILEPTQAVTPLPVITEPPAAQDTPTEIILVSTTPTNTPPSVTATAPGNSNDDSGASRAMIRAAIITAIGAIIAAIVGAIMMTRRN